MDKVKIKVQFIPRYIDVIGYCKIINGQNECISSEIKQFELYYDENGNLIENNEKTGN